MTYLKQMVAVLLVQIQSLALDVRSVFTHLGLVFLMVEGARAFVPSHAGPL